jgi:hypothetical protein
MRCAKGLFNNHRVFIAKAKFGDLISKLSSTTHRLVAADRFNTTLPSTSFDAQSGRSHISAVSLAWSIAQRVSRDINLQATIVHVLLSLFSNFIILSLPAGLDEVVSNVCPTHD